jgi:hypothetical protein
VIQITDNLTYTTGNHTLTFGSSFEKYAFENSFNLEYDMVQDTFDPVGTMGWIYSKRQVIFVRCGTAIRIKFNKTKLTICSNTYDSRNSFAVGGIKDGNWLKRRTKKH